MRPRSVRCRPGPGRAEIFVLPENRSSPSGGNLYNSCLLEALKKEGFSFQIMTLNQALAYARRGGRARYWVDSLYLGTLEDPVKPGLPGPDMFLIVHHLPSLEPGLDGEERRRQLRKEGPVLLAAAGFLATSSLTKGILRRRGNPAAPIFVARPALAVAPAGKKPAGKGFQGLIVANLIRRKGILEFLARLRTRLTSSDRFMIRIAGRSDIEPDYAEACLEEIKRHARLGSAIRYIGPLPPARIKSLYEASTVFIAASLVETYGMAFHEARAFGLPVLAVRTAYTEPHVRPGRTGCLYSTIGGLARGCLNLVRNPERLVSLRESAWDARSRSGYEWSDAARLFIRQVREWENSLPNRTPLR